MTSSGHVLQWTSSCSQKVM